MLLFLQVLKKTPAYKQSIPVRCELCTSRKQASGKVFDVCSWKRKQALFYLCQHAKSMTHQKNVAARKAADISAELDKSGVNPTEPEPFDLCQGLIMNEKAPGHLGYLAKHSQQWLGWRAPCEELKKHTYTFEESMGNCVVRHQSCKKTCPAVKGQPGLCSECLSLLEYVKRSVVLCATKRFAAELLFSRLFEDSTAVDQLVEKLKEDYLYLRHGKKLDVIIGLSTFELQAYVRARFLSIRKDLRSEAFSSFLKTVVEPTLGINVVSISDQKPVMVKARSFFERYLKNAEVDELDHVAISIADASISGRLQGNPMIMGLIVSCLRVLERQDGGHTGIGLTRGRVAKDSAMGSATAKELALESGRALCLAGGNKQLLQLFGCNVRPHKGFSYTAALSEASLPVPFCAISSDDLRNNMFLLDSRLGFLSNTSGRHFRYL